MPLPINKYPFDGVVDSPVPPLAIFNVPPSVKVPDVVMGPPESVKPVVPPEPLTLVTVPEPPDAAMVIEPAPFVIEIPVPAVSVASENPDVDVLPIRI